MCSYTRLSDACHVRALGAVRKTLLVERSKIYECSSAACLFYRFKSTRREWAKETPAGHLPSPVNLLRLTARTIMIEFNHPLR